MELFVEKHVRSQDRQKGVQQFVDNRAQHFVLRQIVMEMRSKMGDDTCAALFLPYGPGNNQPPPPPPPPAPPLF
ncbi:hypothetical protein Peur_061027 [Populus x canadensis]